MNAYALAGSILAFLIYFPLWHQITTGATKQNMLTWGLWGALDAIATVATIAQKGNFLLPIAYTIGGVVTVIIISRTKEKFLWTWFETMVTSLVIVCIIVWYFSGNRAAIIASTTALLIAGVPQLVDAWKRPIEMPFSIYVAYVVANCLATAGGKSWSIEERFYAASAAALCFLFVIVIFARYNWLRRKAALPATT